MKKFARTCLVAGEATLAGAADAQEAASVSANVALTSNYTFQGLGASTTNFYGDIDKDRVIVTITKSM